MKTIRSIIGTFLIIFLSAACVLFVLPRLFGVQLYCIVSGSMEPAYRLNDLIYTVPIECQEISAGDTISFGIAGTDAIVTHRVVENDAAQRCVFTKGDANEMPDSAPVPYENVKGVVHFRIPKIGAMLMMLSSKIGRIISITAGIAIILISMILTVSSGDQEQPQQSRPKRSRSRRKTQDREPTARPAAQSGTRGLKPSDAPEMKPPRRTEAVYQQRPSRQTGQTGFQTPAPVTAPKQRIRTKDDLPPGWR